MAPIQGVSVLPMKAAGTQHFIERIHREGGAFQWVRETYVNALEAGATRVAFGVEWQAVENLGVYRRVIADDGRGMTADQLQEFFNTFGGGGKPIGGVHENYGVGAKTSLLPWNRHGVVVISYADGDASMIWITQDPSTGEYGLRVVEAIDDEGTTSRETVFEPYVDDEHGCNWAAVRPDWLKDHGTVIVLLGDDPADNSVLGDPNRNESDIKGISSYLNRRIWKIQDGVEVTVDELRTQERADWPKNEATAHGSSLTKGKDRRTNLRTILGAEYFIRYPVPTFTAGKLEGWGTVTLSDGTGLDWFLWDGERPAVQSYASLGGYIAVLYKDELYDVTAHHSTYRSFGIAERPVRSKLWLVARPPVLDDDDRHGVYPRTDRNALLLKGGPNAGGSLPINDWAGEFADNMPDAILAAIKAARGGGEGTVTDTTWRDRLADRFGSRWRIPKLRRHKGGSHGVDPAQPGGRPIKAKKKRQGPAPGGGKGGRGGLIALGSKAGDTPAAKVKVSGGIPTYRAVTQDEVGDGMLAAWQPNDPGHPEGVVLLNVEHPVLANEIEHWQALYADHHADDIKDEVIKAYGEIAVAKIAHSEFLKDVLPSKTVEDDLRSEPALTMALLGLIGEEAVLAPRLGGKFKRRRAA
ncbi:MAG: hypothetical protein U0T02_01625 [Solirubrobacteraceae bacterium]